MKNFLLLSLLAMTFIQSTASLAPVADDGDIEINDMNFPDKTFRTFLLSQSFGEDEVLTAEEIAGVTTLDLFKLGIRNLKGIELFSNLEYLQCDSNKLSSLDLSQNTQLVQLSCSGNIISKLDVSKNAALHSLLCRYNKLTKLDVSNNLELQWLDCWGNQLKTIDLSNNAALYYLDCDNNQLTSLDVSNNTALKYFYCPRNSLTSLDVSRNTELLEFECHSNHLTSLDVSKNTALQLFNCSDNQLSSLDVSNNTVLYNLYCSVNNLTSLDVSNNTALQYLYCNSNQLNSLDVSKNTALRRFSCNNNTIKETEMDALIASLPIAEDAVLYLLNNPSEGNECTSAQIATIKTKGWMPYYWNPFAGVWLVMEEYETVPHKILSKTIGDVTYTLVKEMADKYNLYTDPDGRMCYRTTFSLQVETGGKTNSYLIDDQIYAEDEAVDPLGGFCMLFDLDAQQLFVFARSKDNVSYGYSGFVYSSPLGEIDFKKEQPLFANSNYGHHANFLELQNNRIAISHFSYDGYATMISSRMPSGKWTTIQQGQRRLNPSDYISLWETQDHTLVIGKDCRLVTEEQYQTALEAIPTKSKFYIYTMFHSPEGLKKYYLTNKGTLSETPDSKPFIFTHVSGATSLFANPGLKLNVPFTNPNLSNGATGELLPLGAIQKYSESRNDWESQVWYKEGDHYAVRSTNAMAVVWGANTYWTVLDTNDDGVPEADYSLTPNFVWQLEDPNSQDNITELTSVENNAVHTTFTLSGQRLSQPSHGINIVRMNDGMTRKVIIK